MKNVVLRKIPPKEFDDAPAHRPRIIACPNCERKFPDEVALKKHRKDKKH